MLGFIRRIIPFSSVDGPGNRTAIFMQGCNFHCFYCHNPETQALGDAGGTLPGVAAMDHLEVVAAVLQYRDYISGVTLSGGECTLQLEFILALCKALRESNIEVFIDTNGHLAPDDFILLSQHVDKFMIDVKAWGEGEHLTLTGHTPHFVQANLRYAMAMRKLYEVRTVIVPDALPNYLTVTQTSLLIGASPDVRYKLIKFRPRGVAGHSQAMSSPDDQYMARLKELAEGLGVKHCVIV